MHLMALGTTYTALNNVFLSPEHLGTSCWLSTPHLSPQHPQALRGGCWGSMWHRASAQMLPVQHLLPVPNPRFSTFLQLPISFPTHLLKSLQIPPAQCRGRTTDSSAEPPYTSNRVTGATYNHSQGHPCSQIMHFSILPTLPSLSFPFLAVFPPRSRKASSQHFLLLHLDSVSFISHKCMCRFLHFFICSLRRQ